MTSFLQQPCRRLRGARKGPYERKEGVTDVTPSFCRCPNQAAFGFPSARFSPRAISQRPSLCLSFSGLGCLRLIALACSSRMSLRTRASLGSKYCMRFHSLSLIDVLDGVKSDDSGLIPLRGKERVSARVGASSGGMAVGRTVAPGLHRGPDWKAGEAGRHVGVEVIGHVGHLQSAVVKPSERRKLGEPPIDCQPNKPGPAR